MTTARQPVKTVRIRARDEDYRVVQVQGMLIVCSKENGSCCCGWEEKGRLPIPNDAWGAEWESRRLRSRLHLSFSGCLGPCIAGNNALLLVHGREIWLKDLNSADFVPAVFDYVEEMLDRGEVFAPSGALEGHIFNRFRTPPAAEWLSLVAEDGEGGLEDLDPVCLMHVDSATARHRVVHEGREYVFCAPSCRKAFVADPAAYAVA